VYDAMLDLMEGQRRRAKRNELASLARQKFGGKSVG